MNDFVSRVINWNKLAGNTDHKLNPPQASLYVGLILEEVAELLTTITPYDPDVINTVIYAAERFKSGECVPDIEEADRVEMLDAAADIAVVAIGLAMSLGADVQAVLHEVCDSNDTKTSGGRLLKDINGKIIKPDTYRPPFLEEHLRDG